MRWVSTSRLMHARRQAREIKRVKAKIKDAQVEMRTKSDHFYEAKKVNRSVVRRIVSKIDLVALIFYAKTHARAWRADS